MENQTTEGQSTSDSVKPVIQMEQPMPTQEPKQSNFLVMLLSVLLLISVIIAGFFAYQTQRLVTELRVKNEEMAVKPTPTVTIEPTEESVATDSAMMGESTKTPISTQSAVPTITPDLRN